MPRPCSAAITIPQGAPADQEDRALTKRLVDAGRLLGIHVIDHLILGDGSETYYSFADEGSCRRRPVASRRPLPTVRGHWRRRPARPVAASWCKNSARCQPRCRGGVGDHATAPARDRLGYGLRWLRAVNTWDGRDKRPWQRAHLRPRWQHQGQEGVRPAMLSCVTVFGLLLGGICGCGLGLGSAAALAGAHHGSRDGDALWPRRHGDSPLAFGQLMTLTEPSEAEEEPPPVWRLRPLPRPSPPSGVRASARDHRVPERLGRGLARLTGQVATRRAHLEYLRVADLHGAGFRTPRLADVPSACAGDRADPCLARCCSMLRSPRRVGGLAIGVGTGWALEDDVAAWHSTNMKPPVIGPGHLETQKLVVGIGPADEDPPPPAVCRCAGGPSGAGAMTVSVPCRCRLRRLRECHARATRRPPPACPAWGPVPCHGAGRVRSLAVRQGSPM